MADIIPTSELRLSVGEAALTRSDEETLVVDDRGALTPSQMVEQKLIGRLRTSPLMISQVQRRLRPGPR
ncbi:hypothetical protein [Frigoriglobus tundricola]|uniref:Uncharacterized protein n=1 Tax=Frigoriglobus tundricola TaxID=2774151 RepID=A0A6M5Z4U0_9BACT|nr:hypothetical protein [Frigoriglobus tundricola]QJX00522.1 hypothetical protein FTUN_8152 [Frigoriglobus tundricola]